jgi:hypothetical protein
MSLEHKCRENGGVADFPKNNITMSRSRTRRSFLSRSNLVEWTGCVFQKETYLYRLLPYLDVEDIVLLSLVDRNVKLKIHGDSFSDIWKALIENHFNVNTTSPPPLHVDNATPMATTEATAVFTLGSFRDHARERIWNWNRVFERRGFWARMGFTLSNFFEDSLIFGCSFSSSSNSSPKLDHDFEDWDDGHRIVFYMPENFYLSYEVNDHTMGTWRVGKGNLHDKNWFEVDRLDGHPIGPGFSYLEAEVIISYITGDQASSPLNNNDNNNIERKRMKMQPKFDPRYLWPLFFPAIALPSEMKFQIPAFIDRLRIGWKELRLPKKNYQLLEEYLNIRVDENNESKRGSRIKPRHWDKETDQCFNQMMNAIKRNC